MAGFAAFTKMLSLWEEDIANVSISFQ